MNTQSNIIARPHIMHVLLYANLHIQSLIYVLLNSYNPAMFIIFVQTFPILFVKINNFVTERRPCRV